jgi:hypothetical protein
MAKLEPLIPRRSRNGKFFPKTGKLFPEEQMAEDAPLTRVSTHQDRRRFLVGVKNRNQLIQHG